MSEKAPVFAGSIAGNYHQYIVPLFSEDYAADLAQQLTVPSGGAVLELACGTGVVTKYLRDTLPASTRLVATDLNPGMLETAQGMLRGVSGIEFQTADGTDLSFEDALFDAVVCQFGVMFFPDKAQGFAEAARVLKPGGRLHFNVWDSLEHNAINKLLHETVVRLCPDITFMALPCSYCDVSTIKATLEAVGFHSMEFSIQPRKCQASSVNDVVLGFMTGSPLAAALEERGLLAQGREAIESALIATYGHGPFSAPKQAIVVTALKPL